MQVEYAGLKEINDTLVILERMEDVSYEEIVEIKTSDKKIRLGRIIELGEEYVVAQVFDGTAGLSTTNTVTRPTGRPMELSVSKDILGRVFDGMGRPKDGCGRVCAEKRLDINGQVLNPVTRKYPRNYVRTGISAIDGMITLIRGQKLPIFSGSGIKHNELAAQIANQARIAEDTDENFAVVFAAMGVSHDVAEYFKRSFEQGGALDRLVMFLNLSNDAVMERIITPRCALTAAEYLAFEHDMHVLVILTDMTAYAEALREISSAKGEIPGRKGYPGYLYSDLASIYERAGMTTQGSGSITQIPILTMPNDDITHPIPDLTGYITEGQIVLDRKLQQMGIYPPIAVLPSLSRLMKDGISGGLSREDHADVASQLFALYADVMEKRTLAAVIGEEGMSSLDKKYMEFGRAFENEFISQAKNESRTIDETLDIAWKVMKTLPRSEIIRIDSELLEKYWPKGKKGMSL